MTSRRTRTRLLALALAAVWATGACSGGTTDGAGDAPPAAPSTAATPAETSTPVATSTPAGTDTATTAVTAPSPAAPAAGEGIPAGAGTATTVDLDGDGRPDVLWLADVDGARTLGVTTTAHGTSSVVFENPAPQSATVSAAVLASGAPVVLLDTGRSVQVYGYRVEDPGLVVVPDSEGAQYSFSLGFTDYGTGLVCEQQSDGLHLYGANATTDAAGTLWTVTRTAVSVDVNRPRATNGATTTVGQNLTANDPAVLAAHGSTCGDGAAVASEPQ